MPKRCPPGVLCIENVTIMFIFLILLGIGLFVYIKSMRSTMPLTGTGTMPLTGTMPSTMPLTGTHKGRGDDVFYDIYQPPLRNDSCGLGSGLDIRGNVPINISTQECGDAPYRQVGILTRHSADSTKKEETILPLMGRPLFRRRDKWNFYTLNDKNNMIKLPMRFKGRDCSDEVGCDNMYTGDTAFVEGYNDAFKVTSYNNQLMRYLPQYF